MAKRNVPINYTSRDFNSIRKDLVNYAKRYYPNTFKDFGEASFGALVLDSVAYVGDIMSFYLDYQVNESFIDTSVERDNVLRHASLLGYKYQGPSSTTGIVSVYAIVPANAVGLGPNTSYMPILKSGTTLGSKSGASFILTEDIRFDDPANPTVAARTNTTTGNPSSYAVKAQGQVISGNFRTEVITVGAFERFKKVGLLGKNIVEIVSVFDSEGHEYYEVEYLSHDVIYKAVPNKDSNTRDNAPSLIRPFVAPRRFTATRDKKGMVLQFGYGSDSEISTPSLAEPSNVVLKRHAKTYITDTSFDPSDLMGTDKLGIGPADTQLTITYRENLSNNANAAVGAINRVTNPKYEFNNPTIASSTTAANVISTLECSNEEPIVGSSSEPTLEEIRNQAMNIFPSQNRAVTSTDYEAVVYMMPAYYGSVKRCRVVRDQDSLKRNLNIYIVSESSRGKLIASNSALKQNLRIWLNKYRMVNDTVDILDAKVANIGINFEVISSVDVNKYEVLDACILALREKFSRPMFIGERFYVTDVFTELNKVPGVVDTVNVKLDSKSGGNYSNSVLNIAQNMSLDGRYLSVPDNVVLEVKYPKIDIKGTVK